MPLSSGNVGTIPESFLVTSPLGNVTSNPAQTGRGCEAPPCQLNGREQWELWRCVPTAGSQGSCQSHHSVSVPLAEPALSPSNQHSSSKGLMSSVGMGCSSAQCQAGGIIQEG